jgi:arylformamidase
VTDWIDVTVPVRNGMVHWPGDPAFHIKRIHDQLKGEVCTVSQMTLGVHTGTHMDAPLHFLKDGVSIDRMPLDAVIGPARVIQIQDRQAIRREELEQLDIEALSRVLFKTANSDHLWRKNEFDEDFIYIARDAAEYLASCGVRTVGVDYLSVGGFRQDGVETHEALLGAGIWVVEGLDLSGVEPGLYEMICLPLKLMNAEGSPARAVLRSMEA